MDVLKALIPTVTVFLWVPFLILFFHVFVKHKRDLRFKYVFVPLVLLFLKFYLSTNENIVHNNVKLCNRLQFYSPDYISTCNELHEICLQSQFSILTISKLRAISNNKYFYRLILIFSGDISLNSRSAYNHHPPNLKQLNIFKIQGFHLLHLNVNNLLPQTDQLRFITKLSKAAVIGITIKT